MFDRQEDVVERVIEQLRRPVAIDPKLDARVMREIARVPSIDRRVPSWALWSSLATAAVLAFVVVAHPWSRSSATTRSDLLQFVLVAPQAASVSLVGDFNDWDPARSPMQTAQGVWATAVRLAPGRYRYAFLVNGVEWRADPGAPSAKDDEFGTPSSVVTVGGKGS
ncbi:MAG TPA: isoamylase early set domain-containing protein [Gemmatimonadales bacterium]